MSKELFHPKAIFFDVDGTLVSVKNHKIRSSTLDALHLLREKGIRLFIATGRCKMMIPDVEKYFPFDGVITINGQYCYTPEKVLRRSQIGVDNIERLKGVVKDHPFPCFFVEDNDIYVTAINEDVKNLFKFVNHPLPEIRPIESVKGADVIQFAPFLEHENQVQVLKNALQNVTISRSVPYCFDVVPDGGGKDVGMQVMLDHFGIKPEETMAFGDGTNDLGMLSFAKIGVAMGDAKSVVKRAADYVTTSSEEDGIYKALRQLKIL